MSEHMKVNRDSWKAEAEKLAARTSKLTTENADLRARLAQAEAWLSCMSNHPPICPVSGQHFFMTIEHPTRGMVATYGGPFDSYTIPEANEEGELFRERYDHDRGHWIDGQENICVRIVAESDLTDNDARLGLAEKERDAARMQLAEAATLIRCSGPLTHRIQILLNERQQAINKRDAAVKALRAWEKWEADLIMSNEAWGPNGMAQFPRLTQALYDDLIRLQGVRNAVLAELEKGGEGK